MSTDIKDMTDADFAAMNFDPWPGEPDLKRFGASENDHLAATRLAYLTMFKTKDELTAFAREEPDAFLNLAESLGHSADAFAEMVTLIRSAKARMMCACAAWVEAV